MACRLPSISCLLILLLLQVIRVLSEEKETCRFEIFSGSYLAVTCGKGPDKLDKVIDWVTERPLAPIDIAPGIQLFRDVADTGQRSLFHIEDRSLELESLNILEGDRKSFVFTNGGPMRLCVVPKEWEVTSPVSIVNSTVWLANCMIYSGLTTSTAGGLFVSGSRVFVNDCSFLGDSAPKDQNKAGSIRMTSASSLYIRDSTFQNVKSDVAAVYADGSSFLDISSTSFEKVKGNYGSAIYAKHGSSVRIENSTFSNCASGNTGAVAVENGKSLDIQNCNFMLNKGKNGAAVNIISPPTVGNSTISENREHLRIAKSQFQSNSARQSGGALYVVGTDLTMNDSQILGNQAADLGAGLYVDQVKSVLIDSCAFEGQTFQANADKWYEQTGSGIYAENIEAFRLFGSRLIGNEARNMCGGGCFTSLLVLEIQNTSISENKAKQQAGIGVKSVKAVMLRNLTVFKNVADEFAGGMSFLETMRLTLSDVIAERNSASDVGAMSALSATNVRMDRCMFRGNIVTDGGSAALKLAASLNVSISQSKFLSNRAKGEAAGLLAQSVDYMSIDRCVFKGNRAHSGASCLIRLAKAVHIDASSFTNSHATVGSGGALFADQVGRARVQNATFTGNTAQNEGGAFSISGTPRVTCIQTSFHQNNSTMGSGGAFMAKQVDNVYLQSCRFVQNGAFRDGGAVSLGSVYNELEIRKSDFVDNEAVGRVESQGGAIAVFLFSNMLVENSQFRDNKARRNGGALALPGTARELSRTLVMTADMFTGNEAVSGAGGALYFEKAPHLEVNRGAFQYNRASLGGGAILIQKGESASFSETRFIENSLIADVVTPEYYDRALGPHPDEMGILPDDEETSVVNVRTHPNRIKNGGAIALIEIGQTTLMDTELKANVAPGSGGAAFIQSSRNVVSQGSTFSDNVARTTGGGLFIESVQEIAIDSSVFTDNGAIREEPVENYRGRFELNGGAIVVKDSQNVHMKRVQCSHNNATDSGGAMSFDNVTQLSVQDCQFWQNRALNGGAMHVFQSDLGVIDHCVFTENEGGYFESFINEQKSNKSNAHKKDMAKKTEDRGHGGAVIIKDSYHFNLTAPEFRSNVAHGRGGALYCAGSENLALSHSHFIDNTALLTGGAISLDSGNLTLSIDRFTSNHAVNGSLLSVSGGVVNGTDLQTYQNMAEEHGGLVYCTKPSNISLATSKFVDDGSNLGDSFMAACSCQVAILESKIVCSNDDVKGCGSVEPNSECPRGITLETANVIYYNKFWSIFKLIVPALVAVPLLVLIVRFCMHTWTRAAKKVGFCKESGDEPLIDGYPNIWGPLDDSDITYPRENHPSSTIPRQLPMLHRPSSAIEYARPVDSVQSIGLQSHRLLEEDAIDSPGATGPDAKVCIARMNRDFTVQTALESHMLRSGITGYPFYFPALQEHRIEVDVTPSSPEDTLYTCHTIHEQQDFKFEYDQMAETRSDPSI